MLKGTSRHFPAAVSQHNQMFDRKQQADRLYIFGVNVTYV